MEFNKNNIAAKLNPSGDAEYQDDANDSDDDDDTWGMDHNSTDVRKLFKFSIQANFKSFPFRSISHGKQHASTPSSIASPRGTLRRMEPPICLLKDVGNTGRNAINRSASVTGRSARLFSAAATLICATTI